MSRLQRNSLDRCYSGEHTYAILYMCNCVFYVYIAYTSFMIDAGQGCGQPSQTARMCCPGQTRRLTDSWINVPLLQQYALHIHWTSSGISRIVSHGVPGIVRYNGEQTELQTQHRDRDRVRGCSCTKLVCGVQYKVRPESVQLQATARGHCEPSVEYREGIAVQTRQKVCQRSKESRIN